MNATVEIRNSKTRPDNKFITEFFQKNQSTKASFNFIEEAIGKLIKNKKTVNKPTIQGMMSYFLISNDQLGENEVTESEPISSDISTPLPSNICKWNFFKSSVLLPMQWFCQKRGFQYVLWRSCWIWALCKWHYEVSYFKLKTFNKTFWWK